MSQDEKPTTMDPNDKRPVLVCFTRDDVRHEFPGPPNCANGDHRVTMRFSVDQGTFAVTFRKYDNSERYGEIASEKLGVR